MRRALSTVAVATLAGCAVAVPALADLRADRTPEARPRSAPRTAEATAQPLVITRSTARPAHPQPTANPEPASGPRSTSGPRPGSGPRTQGSLPPAPADDLLDEEIDQFKAGQATGVALQAVISTAERRGDVSLYGIEVRALEGTAQDTWVTVTTKTPAQWVTYPTTCSAALAPTAQPTDPMTPQSGRVDVVEASPGGGLDCRLGDVSGSVVLRVGLRMPSAARMAEVADVMAVARAANAEAAVATAELASVEEGAGFALPLSDPAALPVPQRKVGHAKPTVIKKVKKAKVRTPVRSSTSSSVPPSSYVPPSSPLQMSAQAPVQSLTPMMPPLEQQAQSLNPLLPGGATLPPAVPIESKAPSSLSMITTSDLELGDRGSWLTVLAIAVVAEVALLWFAAALGVWRRKLALNTGHPLPHPIKAARRGLRKLRLRRG